MTDFAGSGDAGASGAVGGAAQGGGGGGGELVGWRVACGLAIGRSRLRPGQNGSPPESLEERFRKLKTEWEDATQYHSSTRVITGHPAYREIITLGKDVVPLLLRDMEETHNHWFCALREITGAQPIPESAAGNIPRMVQIWLAWAREHGYRW
jgi:hypothetical protein